MSGTITPGRFHEVGLPPLVPEVLPFWRAALGYRQMGDVAPWPDRD